MESVIAKSVSVWQQKFGEAKMTKDELKLAFQKAFQMGQDYWYHANHEFESYNKKSDAIKEKFNEMVKETIEEALAQPEQDTNKNGSPCPEFWDWLPKAYNFEGNGNFTKYNMEVAFLAGKQAPQTEQEPVVWMYVNRSTHETIFQRHMRSFVDHGNWTETPLYSEPLANHELNCVCGAVWCGDEMVHLPHKSTPPQRTWVGLTEQEQGAIMEDLNAHGTNLYPFAQAIEAKLKEKNT